MKISLIQHPIYKPIYGRRSHVRGVGLSSSHFASGKSLLKGGEKKTGTLLFHSTVFNRARDQSARTQTLFAKLTVQISRDKASRQFQITIADDTDIEYTSPLSEKLAVDTSMVPRRCIFLVIGDDFGRVRKPKKSAKRLLLPDDAHQSTGFLEIHLSLSIEGSDEAELDLGDILDIPLVPRLDSLVSFKLLDHHQEPLMGKQLRIKDPDGDILEETTDENGEIFLEADEGEAFEFLGIVPEQHPNSDVTALQLNTRGLLVPARHNK